MSSDRRVRAMAKVVERVGFDVTFANTDNGVCIDSISTKCGQTIRRREFGKNHPGSEAEDSEALMKAALVIEGINRMMKRQLDDLLP